MPRTVFDEWVRRINEWPEFNDVERAKFHKFMATYELSGSQRDINSVYDEIRGVWGALKRYVPYKHVAWVIGTLTIIGGTIMFILKFISLMQGITGR